MSETCANPLLLGWIKEWLDEARERNTKGVTVYKKAYESMKACPLAFQHPSEAQQLNGLGPKLCDRLTKNLQAYCDKNGLPMPEDPRSGMPPPFPVNITGNILNTAFKQQRKPIKEDLLMEQRKANQRKSLAKPNPTLDENSTQSMTKAQLIDTAQPYCDSSFTAPSDPSKFFTAWNSMKTLLQKDLVYIHGHPLKKYALTEEGWEVAKAIIKTLPKSDQSKLTFGVQPDPTLSGPSVSRGDNNNNNNNNGFRDTGGSGVGPNTNIPARLRDENNGYTTTAQNPHDDQWNASDNSPVTPIMIPPDRFTIQLILDTREVRTSTDRDYISNELNKKGITLEVRALELGDIMWVAKFHDPAFLSQYGEEGDEIMLDWIVERKRLDDLIGSVKDGRFHEQKFRLQRSGIKNVIYLVEEFSVVHESNHATAAKYHEMVSSAIASTQVVNGYFVKRTKNLDDSIRYLARMTALLKKMYSPSASSPNNPPPNTVSLIPSRQLSASQPYLATLERLRAENPAITYGVTFPTFSALASKSDSLTLRDVFLKMLMCTRGVTGDKALEIQRRWPTPQAFIQAFEALDPKDRETMVSGHVQSYVGRKKIAKVLGKKIAEIWCEKG